MSAIQLRPATEYDAAFTLYLSELASFGLVSRIFTQLLPPGQTLNNYLMALASDPTSKLSWTKCQIAELSGTPVGFISLEPIPLYPEPPGPATPAIFRPLAELEAQAPGTVVIEFVATLPAARRKGVGTALMHHAYDRRGPNGVSLVVFDTNFAARRLYERAGFVEQERRQIVQDATWQLDASEWVLMIRR